MFLKPETEDGCFDKGGGAKVFAPKTSLSPVLKKLNLGGFWGKVVGVGPGSVLDFPKENRFPGLLTALLKEKGAALVAVVPS